MKIVLLANTDWYLANFRFDLACALRDGGAEVHCIAPPGKYLDWLGEQGFPAHALKMGDESYSLRDNRRTFRHLVELYRDIAPSLAHHFTPRCVVLGSLAARRAGVPRVVNALTGLGHVFTSDGLKSRLARPVLRGLLRRSLNGEGRAVIFQNQDDMDELLRAGVVEARHCRLVRGSGVDTGRFCPRGVQDGGENAVENAGQHSGERADSEIRVLFASRLIGEKGIHELVAAMARVVAAFPNAVLWVAGDTYAQNPTSLTSADLAALGALPYVKLLGHRDDVVALLGEADIVALPSYREGTPKILLEAAACGLPIVATDIAGCRGVVEEGRSGYLVPVRDVNDLAARIGKLCGDAALRAAMGQRGREIVVEGFGSETVIERTLEVYAGLLEPGKSCG